MKLPAFWVNATTVLAGTAMAQVIPLAVLPLLTRLLAAEQLGEYFAWFAGVAIALVFATARLDVAVFSARTRDEVGALFRAVVVVSGAVACAGLAAGAASRVLAAGGVAARYLEAGAALAAILAINQTLLAILVYRAEFRRLARAKVVLAVAVSLAQLLLCAAGAGTAGLIYGQLAAALAVTLVLMHQLGFPVRGLARELGLGELRQTLATYWRFPAFSLPSGLLNALAAQLPVFIVLEGFGAAQAAFYALTFRVLIGPVGLLANSVLAAFKEQAGREYREQGNCVAAYRGAFRSLAALAIVPFTLVWLIGEQAFALVFGPEWMQAGRFAEMLAPMFALKFVASPLSYTLFVANRQLHDLAWQIVLLAMTVAVFTYDAALDTLMVAYSAGYTALYLVYLAISYDAARGTRR